MRCNYLEEKTELRWPDFVSFGLAIIMAILDIFVHKIRDLCKIKR